MNENFKNKLSESGLTSYALSKRTGIPYTTINELANEKASINRCAAETVLKISEELGVSVSDILDPFSYVEGVRGRYMGYSYRFVKDEETGKIVVSVLNKEGVPNLDTDGYFTHPNMREIARMCAEIAIRKHIKKEEFENQVKEILNGQL